MSEYTPRNILSQITPAQETWVSKPLTIEKTRPHTWHGLYVMHHTQLDCNCTTLRGDHPLVWSLSIWCLLKKVAWLSNRVLSPSVFI
jgi:hypothetical protein